MCLVDSGVNYMLLENVSVLDGQSGDVSNRRFVVIVSSYNRPITGKLLAGAVDFLQRENVPSDRIRVVWVPGAWELAVAASRVIDVCDAVICLGAVIKGDTTHDQYINSMLSNELGRISVDHKKPVGFGLLTCNTVEQAIQRSGGSVGNKGEEAASAVVSVLRVFDQWASQAGAESN